ncbi:OmpA-OmpF porin, OOP family [Acinetobacter boissieri]|uniref:OmpA-OmpF porin, OOP family n=1 Tax=Acinetobacter boissieri TaxID=1219383 RepID=A0A1G6IJI8_9GAMM|nr:OmpA family protein [Acinetobacter boissieri]SDC06699.1 OmpA-OmpF porin, OOP family [Acinetobacter boissieri]
MKIIFKPMIKSIILYLGLFSYASYAQTIVVEGVVPNDESKQAILTKMHTVYSSDQILDKIQVRAVSAPNGWSDAIANIITPDLKKVSQGKLAVQGTQINLTGKVSNHNDVESVSKLLQSQINSPFSVNTNLSMSQNEQKIVDDTLKNRIVEFESGSVILTPAGMRILDEMSVALSKLEGKSIKIIGHTDSSGDSKKNLILSQGRAEAVKQYLVAKHILAEKLTTSGLGSEKPVADNTTAEGRKKNRRIEFEVL